MAPESPELPVTRLVRWLAVVGLIGAAVVLYFRFGLRLPPLGAHPPVP